MKKKNIIIVLTIIALLALNFSLKPYLRRRDVLKVVQTVLSHWQSGDLTLAMKYWEKEINVPPIYNLKTFTIGKEEISKKNGMYSAKVPVTLEFPPGNLMPSGKQWVFKLNKTHLGWQITDFRRYEGGHDPQP